MKKACFLALLIFSIKVWAQQPGINAQSAVANAAITQIDTTPLKELGSQYQNGIKLLQNRFRIDYKVDEITMVFFRKYGSAPIVLVRPDGSKIFQSQAIDNDVEWYDAATYDIIRMREPMPGPWQAVGEILPESRVMVVSDIELITEPLPEILFSGEILKQTAYLTNGGKPIDYAEFRDVVDLNMEFASTNNPNFNNFGAQTQIVATFQDNGKGMDEIPLDGTFTGQFNLSIPNGEWRPTFTVSTPMFSREDIGEPIVLHPNPISVDVELDQSGRGFHLLKVDANREMIDINTLLIDGKVKYPNSDVQNFSITRLSSDVRQYNIVNYEYGIYRVKLTAYGNTATGRDFILDVPEFTFLAEEPELEMAVSAAMPADLEEQLINSPASSPMMQDKMQTVEDESMPTETLVKLILGINLGIIVIGGGLVFLLVTLKKRGKLGKIDVSGVKHQLTALLGKLTKKKSKKENEKP
ncbi:TIGR03503 family protein [Alteromonas sp. a30]|uniref:TIGR03503 family protein n=1 Tax=Alteromonas sp. a30 TaxID=2730917 RepID=UPI002282622C|nr:TIGR03503 family protein [Alteromonas sp. a30]MCY7293921.1 TIGR03503 family protein [Alteromonas sp. a30]